MRKLKFAISNIAWEKEKDEEMYTYLSDHGFKGIEIAPTRIFEENPYDRLEEASIFNKSVLKKYGLQICSMQSIWFGRQENIFGSEKERVILTEYTKKAIDFAEQIGCGNLVFGCPRNRNIENKDEKHLDIACTFFKELGDYASTKNVVIAIEPNPVIYNTNFLNTTSEVIDFVRRVNNENIKINCDLGTVIYNEESIEEILEHIDLINHIHISEPNLVPIVHRELHKNFFDNLEKNGYSNFISIEMKKVDEATVKNAICYVENL